MSEYIKGLISVIVPVYNAAHTVERCVGSLLNQTYHDLEIILVDDASEDSSRDVLMRLEQSDPDRIIVICNDENAGPGGARNIALHYARGEFIGFVDSDDYVQSTFYEKLIAEMNSGDHDIVDCGYFNEAQDKAMLHTGRDTRGVLSDARKCDLIVSGGYLWSRLYRRELMEKCGILFREKCILEDSEVLVSLIAQARSVGAVEETLYWYAASEGSASKKNSAASYIENICGAIQALYGLRDSLDNYEALRPAIECEIIQMYGYGVVMALTDAQNGPTIDTLGSLKRLRELRMTAATPGYDNRYVSAKIEKADIDVMKANDEDPKALIYKVTGRAVTEAGSDTASMPDTVTGIKSFTGAAGKSGTHRYRLAAALIQKNEARYLKEWIEYHILMGVEHFYVYDHGSTDGSVEIWQPYIERGLAELTNVTGEHHPAQMTSYNDAVKRSRGVAEYLALIDADEFLIPVKHDRAIDAIDEIFRAYEETPFKFPGSCAAGGIGVNWRVYGTSDHETPADGLVIDEYRYRGPDDLMINCHIKSIVKPECVKTIINPHFAIYEEGYWCISEHGSLIPTAFFYDSRCDILRVNHYYTKSEQEYRERRLGYVRKEAGRQRLATEEEITHTNEVYDDCACRFSAAVREAIDGCRTD